MVILDMDTFISEELASNMLRLSCQRKGEAFKFNRRVPEYPGHPKNGQPHPAVCLLRVEDYWNVGGCEEDLVGHYGWTDPSFGLDQLENCMLLPIRICTWIIVLKEKQILTEIILIIESCMKTEK